MSRTKEQKDAFCLNLIKNSKSSEVTSWLQDNSKPKTLGLCGSTVASIQLIQEVLDAGAVQVFAVEINEEEGFDNTGKLCIELPNDPELRKSVLDWTGKIEREQGYDQELDIGQKYVFVGLD